MSDSKRTIVMEADALAAVSVEDEAPCLLYRREEHEIYWLGIREETAFRCNCYLIRDGETGYLIDPGNRAYFDQVHAAVSTVMAPEALSGMILCHQDPDVAASLCDWLERVPRMKVYTSPRTQVLLPHYGCVGYDYVDITRTYRLPLSGGRELRFVEAPFLHFPGAFVTYDTLSGYLFSGDIWAALDVNWQLVIDDFEEHIANMDLFHTDYMASNLAARGFVENLNGLSINAILPQHGSIIPPKHVDAALDYLRHLRCGTDICYAHLQP